MPNQGKQAGRLEQLTACLSLIFAGLWLWSQSSPASAMTAITIEAETVATDAVQARHVRLQWQALSPQSVSPSHAATPLASQASLADRLRSTLELSGQIRLPPSATANPEASRGRPSRGTTTADGDWQALELRCTAFTFTAQHVQCRQGVLHSEGKAGTMHLPFLAEVALGKQGGFSTLGGTLSLQKAAFSDASGQHAAEQLLAHATFDASQHGPRWDWRAALEWQGGELFWQPFYLAGGGHRLQASGSVDGHLLHVAEARLQLKDIGQLQASADWQWNNRQWQSLDLTARNIDLGQAYPRLIKPMLQGGAMGELEVAGHADFNMRLRQQALQSFHLQLRQLDFEDIHHRYALYKLDADIPWDYDAPQQAELAFAGGHLLKIPLAASRLQAKFDRYALTAPELKIHILDGALVLSDVSAAYAGGDWHWHLQANLTPLDMPNLSSTLGWPRMEGKVAAAIPQVTYSAGHLTTDGALGFNLFNGSIRMSNLTMDRPLGAAAQLRADLEMHNLDLGALSRTFSFGAIEGQLDGEVNGLLLSNWQPVAFDAAFRSSPGRFPKKISQRAVENISALGGAGAAAAIQRSILRFFKEFNYQTIAWRCHLQDGVCAMGGVRDTPQGFVIVQGSGVPAITVMGYNRQVSWVELVSRVKAVLESNAKPVIR